MTAADLLRQALAEDPGYRLADWDDEDPDYRAMVAEVYDSRGLKLAGSTHQGTRNGLERWLHAWRGPGGDMAGILTLGHGEYSEGDIDHQPRVVAVTPVTTYQLAADENWRN